MTAHRLLNIAAAVLLAAGATADAADAGAAKCWYACSAAPRATPTPAAAAKIGEIALPIDGKTFSLDPSPVPELTKALEDTSPVLVNGQPQMRPATPEDAQPAATPAEPQAPGQPGQPPQGVEVALADDVQVVSERIQRLDFRTRRQSGRRWLERRFDSVVADDPQPPNVSSASQQLNPAAIRRLHWAGLSAWARACRSVSVACRLSRA